MSGNPEERKLLYRGTSSEVYEVPTDSRSGSKRVMKITNLPKNLDSVDGSKMDREESGKMVRDHESLRDLKHPNLVQLFGITVDSNEYKFIVEMELIEGQSLEKRITDARGLSEKDTRLYSKQICSALKHLHDNDVIHRNISGKTVMITNDNVVKLIDYGISIQLLDDASRYQTGCPRGEPQFMAPELCILDESQSGFTFSRESDIWAFGCLVFYMVTGKRPLDECRNMMAIVRKICDGEPPKLPDTCSEALRSFHQKCMAKERKQRTSAADLLLQEFLTATSIQ